MPDFNIESFRELFPENNQKYIVPYNDFHNIWENEFTQKYKFIRFLYIGDSLPVPNDKMKYSCIYFNEDELTSDLKILLKTNKVTHYCKYPLPVSYCMGKLVKDINEELKDNFGDIKILKLFNIDNKIMIEGMIEDKT